MSDWRSVVCSSDLVGDAALDAGLTVDDAVVDVLDHARFGHPHHSPPTVNEGSASTEQTSTTTTGVTAPLTRSLSGVEMEGPYSPPALSSCQTGAYIPAGLRRPRGCRCATQTTPHGPSATSPSCGTRSSQPSLRSRRAGWSTARSVEPAMTRRSSRPTRTCRCWDWTGTRSPCRWPPSGSPASGTGPSWCPPASTGSQLPWAPSAAPPPPTPPPPPPPPTPTTDK